MADLIQAVFSWKVLEMGVDLVKHCQAGLSGALNAHTHTHTRTYTGLEACRALKHHRWQIATKADSASQR
eukprot:737246-Pelagomonas_calceolata.AAC.1